MIKKIAIIESSLPCYLIGEIEVFVIICSRRLNQGKKLKRKIHLDQKYLRYIKVILSMMQLPLIIQGSTLGMVGRFNKNLEVLSDGILSEILYEKGLFRCKRFHSLFEIKRSISRKKKESIILGSNWSEFGCMTRNQHQKLIKCLMEMYTESYYFPHPKELIDDIINSDLQKRVLVNNENFENYLEDNGIPEEIICCCGSTALLTAAQLTLIKVKVILIRISDNLFDGPLGNITDPYTNAKFFRMDTNILYKFTSERLEDNPLIHLTKYNLNEID